MTTRPRVLASTIATFIVSVAPILAPAPAHAQLNWDAANSNNTWANGATQNWRDDLDIPVTWANDQLAIFAGTGETVTINSPGTAISAAGLRFDGSGYTIAGTGANGTLTIGSQGIAVTTAGHVATISAPITGTVGLTRSGAGTLTLSGANSYTGGLILNGGITRLTGANTFAGGIALNSGATLELSSAGADNTAYNNFLGAAANVLTFDGGRLWANAATTGNVDRTITARSMVIEAGGATIETPGTYNGYQEGVFNQLRTSGTHTLTGTGTLTKDGGGRLTFSGTNATGFSGPVVMNNGTWEVAGTALGNASATNTITINGGHLALTGNAAQKIILNGGGLGSTGGSRVVTGAVEAQAASYIFTNDFWRDFESATSVNSIARNVTISGQLTGSANIDVAVNRAAYRYNSGAFVLQNPTNTYSGTITVGKNLRLENNPTGGVGSALGAASVVLADGTLTLRDNGTAIDGSLAYGNNVSVIAPTGMLDRGTLSGTAIIDVNRASGTNTGNTFKLGGLTIGNKPLTVQGGNGYGVEFGGASQLTADATLNVTTASLAFSGALGEDATGGRSLTKTGAGLLSIAGNAIYTGATIINGGTVAVSGAGGTISGTSGIAVNPGASFHIDNSAANAINRIPDALPITLTDGTLIFSSQSGAAVAGAETIGDVTLASGVNTITVNRGDAGAASVLTTSALIRQNNASVKFTGAGLGTAGNSPRFVIANKASEAFMGGWVTVNNEFAQYVATGDASGPLGVTAVAGVTDPANDSGFAADQNLRIVNNTTTSLTSNRALNTVNFANTADGATLALGANTLTVAGGGILVGTNAAAITGTGNLTSGTAELVVTNNAALNIGATVANNGANAVSLVKAGTGTLTLANQNTYTGDTIVSEGTLSIANVADSGTASSLGSNGRLLLGVTGAPATLQFTGATDSTNRALVVGSQGGTINVGTAASTLSFTGDVTGGHLTATGAGTTSLSGTKTLEAITVASASRLTLGGNTTVGAATVSGGSTLSAGGDITITGDLHVGNGSNGTLTGLAGGNLSVGSGPGSAIHIGSETIASGVATTGTANLSNLASFTANVGTIQIGVEGIGTNGAGINTGTLILPANSTIVATTSIVLGDSPGDGGGTGNRGTLTFGAGLTDVTTPLLTIGGRKYNGVSTIGSGGTLMLGNGATGTTLNVGMNAFDTGTAPASTFNLSGGTLVANLSSVTVGMKVGGGAAGKSTGTLDLGTSDGTNVVINGTAGNVLRVGVLEYTSGSQPTSEQATGTLIIGGGNVTVNSTVTSSSAVVIGNFANSSVTISGATAANSATGTMTINGGNVTINSAGTSSAINLGARSVTGTPAGTNTSSGTLNLNGGTLTVNNAIGGNSTNAASTSTLNITGGTLNMQGKNISSINNLTFSGGTIRNLATLNRALTQTGENSLLDVVANNTTIQGAYEVTDGNVNVAAGRTLAVSAPGTTLNGTATLTVNGSITGSLTVNAGATVAGSGLTQALTLAGGILSPGNSAGTLNTGNLTLNGGTLSLELGGTNPGLDYDQINVAGTVSLTSDTNFTLALGFTPTISDSFVLISNDGTDAIAGAGRLVFGGVTLTEGAIFDVGGSSFRISYAGGSSNNDIVLQTVPEPSTAVAPFGGIGTLLGLQRFRRRSK